MVAIDKDIPLVVIVGPTAVGKTKLSINIAKKINGEIICADSWTIRKEMDIGTAKPTKNEIKEIPHHLIDIIEPCEKFSAAQFKELAIKSIIEIRGRNKVPILVGGSGLYIYSVLYDYSFINTTTKNREELNKLSIDELINKINKLKLNLASVDNKNKRRLIRLIETKGQKPNKKSLLKNTFIIGLKADKKYLDKNIINRTNSMLSHGLQKEVNHLVKKYGWSCEGLKGVNYAQWQNENNLDLIKTNLIRANKLLAKKQMTWLKNNKSIHWFEYPFKPDQIISELNREIKIKIYS